jgi:hypothetical protein
MTLQEIQSLGFDRLHLKTNWNAMILKTSIHLLLPGEILPYHEKRIRIFTRCKY